MPPRKQREDAGSEAKPRTRRKVRKPQPETPPKTPPKTPETPQNRPTQAPTPERDNWIKEYNARPKTEDNMNGFSPVAPMTAEEKKKYFDPWGRRVLNTLEDPEQLTEKKKRAIFNTLKKYYQGGH